MHDFIEARGQSYDRIAWLLAAYWETWLYSKATKPYYRVFVTETSLITRCYLSNCRAVVWYHRRPCHRQLFSWLPDTYLDRETKQTSLASPGCANSF